MTLEFLFLCLVAWRITYALVYEDLPFDIMKTWRKAIGVIRPDDYPYVEREGTNALSKMWICAYCMSFWVCLGLSFLDSAKNPVLTAFAMSAVVIFLQRLHDRI